MQLGMIGLGRMGANIVRRVVSDGHEGVVYDNKSDAVEAMANDENITGVSSLSELAEKLKPPRVVWVMVPAETSPPASSRSWARNWTPTTS